MPTRRFERLGLALVLVIGSIVFGDGSLIGDAQAQQQSAPPPPPTPPPTQSPVVNPSNPSTVPQPSYTPLKPSSQSTPSTSATSSGELTPGHQATPNATTRSERTSAAKTRLVHHYRHRGRSALVTYSCGDLGCARTYAWAFPCQYYSRYCYPYDYYQPRGWYRY
jgi:hypothetical protein